MSDDNFTPQLLAEFGGLNTHMDRVNLPKGQSPDCSNVDFHPGAVSSRPGYSLSWLTNYGVNAMCGYTSPDASRHVMTLTNRGDFVDNTFAPPTGGSTFFGFVESNDGTTRVRTLGTELGMTGVSIFGRFYFTTYNNVTMKPQDDPWLYDPYQSSFAQANCAYPSSIPLTATTSTTVGNVAAGTRYLMYVFEDADGNWSTASPVTTYAGPGGKKLSIQFTNSGAAVFRAVKVHVFCTIAGGTTLYNIAPLTLNYAGSGTQTFVVDFQDSDLLASTVSFTPNITQIRCPVASFVAKYGERVIAFGTYATQQPYLATSPQEAQPLYGAGFWSKSAAITNFTAALVNDGNTTVRCATWGGAASWIMWDSGDNNITLRVGRVAMYDLTGAQILTVNGNFTLQWSDDNISWFSTQQWPTSPTNIYPAGAHRYWRILENGAGATDISEIQLLPVPPIELVGPADVDFNDPGLGAWFAAPPGATTVAVKTSLAGRLLGSQEFPLEITGDGATAGAGKITQYITNCHRSSTINPQYFIPPGTVPGILMRVQNEDADNSASLNVQLKGLATNTLYINKTITTPGGATPSMRSDTYWLMAELDGPAASIMAENDDTLSLQIQANGTLGNGKRILIDYLQFYDVRKKFDQDTAYFSGLSSPMYFDRAISPLEFDFGNGQGLRAFFEQSGNCYALKENQIWVTADNGRDPSSWSVDNVSMVVGTPSPRGAAVAADFAIIAHHTGVYKFTGGRPEWISHEISNLWAQKLDNANAARMWVAIDEVEKVVWVGAPDGTTASGCGRIWKCDYSEGWEEGQRKWSYDTYATTDGIAVEITTSKRRVFVGGRRTTNTQNPLGTVFTFGPWTNDGTVTPTVATGSTDPFGRTSGFFPLTDIAPYDWTYAGGVPQRALNDTGTIIPVNGYYWVNFWIYAVSGPTTLTLKNNLGVPDQVVSNLTPNGWVRVTRRFGPAVSPSGTMRIWIDWGTSARHVLLWGQQLSFGQFYQGYTNNAGVVEAGFVATPGIVPDNASVVRADWDGAIVASYTTSPFGHPAGIGRVMTGRAGLRCEGSGPLSAQLVYPDNTLFSYPQILFPNTLPMSSPALNDFELQARPPHQTYYMMKTQVALENAWFNLTRVALWLAPSPYDEFRR